jgi:hypothetical protein
VPAATPAAPEVNPAVLAFYLAGRAEPLPRFRADDEE